MAKILIISAVFPPEPIVSAQISFDIAFSLSQRGNDVTVLSPKPTRPINFKFGENEKSIYPFNHVIINSYTCPESKLLGRLRESFSFGKACAKFIHEHRHEINMVYMNAWPLFAQYFIVRECKELAIPVIAHIQDIYPESFVNKLKIGKSLIYSLFLPIDKYVVQNAKHVICISENMQKKLCETRNIQSSKTSIIPNWQNEEPFLSFIENAKLMGKKDKDNIFTFMYLGNNGPVAGVDFLIKSFILAQISNSRLIIAGGGSKTEECKEIVRNLKADNVFFIPVPDGKVPEIQSIADVMLLPVKKGGAMSSIPSKLPAYMFSAKFIIASLDSNSDTARIINNTDCGIVIEPENEEKMIQTMKNVSCMSIEILNEKGSNGFNYAMRHFSRNINLKKVIDILDTFIDE